MDLTPTAFDLLRILAEHRGRVLSREQLLQHVWGYVVTYGEILVGVALILGIFTGMAAFFGSFMNMNYLLAGTVSTNPMLLILAALLVLAWKTAGWWGLDLFFGEVMKRGTEALKQEGSG